VPFMLRKLASRKYIDLLFSIENALDIKAEFILDEVKPNKNELSLWLAHTQADFNDTVLAILGTLRTIETMWFIIIDVELIKKYGFNCKHTPNKNIPFIERRDTHYDLSDLTVRSMNDVAKLYKDIAMRHSESGSDIFIVQYQQKQLKNLLKEAIRNRKFDVNLADERLQQEITELTK